MFVLTGAIHDTETLMAKHHHCLECSVFEIFAIITSQMYHLGCDHFETMQILRGQKGGKQWTGTTNLNSGCGEAVVSGKHRQTRR